MAEGVDNLVLEQLRLIREDLQGVNDRIQDLSSRVDGQTGILIALGKYIRDIDDRGERLEEKIEG